MKDIAERFKEEIASKKKQLTNTADLDERLGIVKDLAFYHSFIDLKQAEIYLSQFKKLAQAQGKKLAWADFHVCSFFVENHSYKDSWAVAHLQEALNIFTKDGYTERAGDTYLDLAGSYFNMNQYEESEACLESAEEIQLLYPENEFLLARLLNRKAILFSRRLANEKAIEMLLRARTLMEESTKPKTIWEYHTLSQIYSNLGFCYNVVEGTKNCIAAYKRAIGIAEVFGFGTRLAWYYLHLGNAYSSVRSYKKAGDYFKKAIKGTPQDISQYARAGASANLGQLYFMQGSYESALNMYNFAEQLYRENKGLDDDYNFSVLERYKADLQLALGNKKNALNHYDSALEYAIRSGNNKQKSVLYKDLADFYAGEQNYENAFNYQKLYSETREKSVNEEQARALLELEVKYEAEKKEREAEFLRLQTTELQLKALRAQMNPHFIFNSLNSIQGYITGNNPEKAAIFFSKFSRLIRNSLEFSEFDAIPLEDEIQFLEDYLALEQERFKGDFDYRIELDEDDDIEEDIMGIPPMIIQPYVENAIKHGIRGVKSGLVSVKFSLEDEDYFMCVIEDNGVGRMLAAERQDEYREKKHRSMGTTITKERLNLFNQASREQLATQTIDLVDENGKAVGTRIEVIIPVMMINNKYYNHTVV